MSLFSVQERSVCTVYADLRKSEGCVDHRSVHCELTFFLYRLSVQ